LQSWKDIYQMITNGVSPNGTVSVTQMAVANRAVAALDKKIK
jgi:hypothetical protein